MQRLRHPIRSITEPFGKAGLTVAVLALVLAMVGGAYAAGGLTGQQEKQVKKIAKKYAGKPGTNGANGEKGAKGDPGSPGSPGAAGKSVNVTPIAAAEGKCEERAGAEVKQEGAASGTEVCEGSPWTVGGTLPKGRTLKGVWGINNLQEPSGGGEGSWTYPVSFPLPLETKPTAHYIYENNQELVGFTPGSPPTLTYAPQPLCNGTVEDPKAKPGNLCVYEKNSNNVRIYSAFLGRIMPEICPTFNPCYESHHPALTYDEAETYGFAVAGQAQAAGSLTVGGTWAVTEHE